MPSPAELASVFHLMRCYGLCQYALGILDTMQRLGHIDREGWKRGYAWLVAISERRDANPLPPLRQHLRSTDWYPCPP